VAKVGSTPKLPELRFLKRAVLENSLRRGSCGVSGKRHATTSDGSDIRLGADSLQAGLSCRWTLAHLYPVI